MDPTHKERAALGVDDFCAWASISRAHFYREVNAGRLIMRKAGRKSVVTMADARVWLASLPVAQIREVA